MLSRFIPPEPSPEVRRFLASLSITIGLCLLAILAISTWFAAPRWADLSGELRDASLRSEQSLLAPVTWTEWADCDGHEHGVASRKEPYTTREEWVQEHDADLAPFLVRFPPHEDQ